MRVIGVVAASVGLLCSAGFATTAPAAAEQSVSQEAREALASAMEVAKQQADTRWAFTMVYTDHGEGGPKDYRLRFDPRLEEEARWQLLDPSIEALSKDEKKTFKQIQGSNDADDRLIYDKLPIDLDQLVLVAEDDARATFEAAIIDDEMPKKMIEAVKMTVTINKPGVFVEEISMRSTAPFKPAPVAKVDSFEQIQRYAPLTEGGPALLREAHSDVSGKAVFKKFDTKSTTVYSDFDPVTETGNQE